MSNTHKFEFGNGCSGILLTSWFLTECWLSSWPCLNVKQISVTDHQYFYYRSIPLTRRHQGLATTMDNREINDISDRSLSFKFIEQYSQNWIWMRLAMLIRDIPKRHQMRLLTLSRGLAGPSKREIINIWATDHRTSWYTHDGIGFISRCEYVLLVWQILISVTDHCH